MVAADAEQLDRAALGQLVFSDPSARVWLEQLVLPIVQTRMSADLEQLSAAPIVVLMVPLFGGLWVCRRWLVAANHNNLSD